VDLLARIRAFEVARPDDHRALMGELADLAAILAAAWGGGAVAEIIRATGAYGEAMRRLGIAAGAPVVTPAHELVSRLAAAHGGAGKPSGAGGGDVAMAVFADPADRARFAEAAARAGVDLLDLECGAPGVEISRPNRRVGPFTPARGR
jgi:phosphomevalonate kinase